MIEAVILVVFPFAMLHAAISDMLSMTIINRVSLLLIVAFLLVAPATGMTWSQISLHVAAFAATLAVCFSLFAIGAMGGGDAKLIAATSLWFGFSFALMEYLLLASVLGGVLTLSILNYRRSPLAVYASQVGFLRRLADPKEKIPYGIALGIGGLMVFPHSVLAMWVIERLSGN
jgi:prepilin peptidase CpaA